MGRPLGKGIKLEERRRRAIAMVEREDLPQSEVAKQLKVHVRTVRSWLKKYRDNGEKALAAKPTPGRPARLGEAELKRLESILLKGPKAAGYDNDLWTCPRVAEVIRARFGVKYHVDHIVRLLHRMGWSAQKPETRAIERDESKVLGWKRRTLPAIKKKPSA